MKPQHLNTIKKHIAAWLLWFALTSLGMFTSASSEPFYWLRLAVNFSANVVIFYAVFFVLRTLRYNKRFDYPHYFTLSIWEKVEYHCRWQLLIVFAVLAAYTIGMNWFDRATGQPIVQENYVPLGASPDPRYLRIIPYIVVAAALAFLGGLRQWGDRQRPDPPKPVTRWVSRPAVKRSE